MALILRYRLEVPPGINREVYDGLCKQVGNVGLDVQIPLDETDTAMVRLRATFISVEGEHFEERQGAAEGEFTEPDPLRKRPEDDPEEPLMGRES